MLCCAKGVVGGDRKVLMVLAGGNCNAVKSKGGGERERSFSSKGFEGNRGVDQ